jgi:restriction system protein
VAVPEFQAFLLPLLQFAADGNIHTLREARPHMANHLQLTEQDLQELLPSGTQTKFHNRLAWSKVYLQRAGMLEGPKRGHFIITRRGHETLAKGLRRLDLNYLKQFPEFQEFVKGSSTAANEQEDGRTSPDKSPEEVLESAYSQIRAGLAKELIEQVQAASPQFFENLVIELLLKMGYGGSREDAGKAVGQAGDEGIDGIINEDRLGLDVVYIQAKRWAGSVGRPELQKFVGALHGKRARKGVFITTGAFSKDAELYVEHIDPRVVLIDGPRLAHLMIDFGVGVTPVGSYQIHKIDGDYFTEE